VFDLDDDQRVVLGYVDVVRDWDFVVVVLPSCCETSFAAMYGIPAGLDGFPCDFGRIDHGDDYACGT